VSDSDPFVVLGIAPTDDLGTIKRAYFAALKRSPPHADPLGFRSARTAYETLSDPRKRALAVLRAPLPPSELEQARACFQETWGTRIERARESSAREKRAQAAAKHFVERLGDLSFAEACALPP
jgi:curved DNA-binding protein CbpA